MQLHIWGFFALFPSSPNPSSPEALGSAPILSWVQHQHSWSTSTDTATASSSSSSVMECTCCVTQQGSPACRALGLKNLLGVSREFLCPYGSVWELCFQNPLGYSGVKREDVGGDWKDGHQLQFDMEEALQKTVCRLQP